jgi:hypothetical protein
MVVRLLAARQAIEGRLQDLGQNGDQHDERKRMEVALKNLKSLEAESQTWS